MVLAIVLAFVFGYALTIRGRLLASGMTFRQAGRLAFASDTLSITTMEIVDTAIILAIPGAMAAGLTSTRCSGGAWPLPWRWRASSPTR